MPSAAARRRGRGRRRPGGSSRPSRPTSSGTPGSSGPRTSDVHPVTGSSSGSVAPRGRVHAGPPRRRRRPGAAGSTAARSPGPTPTSAAASTITNSAKTPRPAARAPGAPRPRLHTGQLGPDGGVRGHQDQVDGVEHQLDRHQHQDRVPAAQHAVDAEPEEQGGDHVRDDRVHQALRPLVLVSRLGRAIAAAAHRARLVAGRGAPADSCPRSPGFVTGPTRAADFRALAAGAALDRRTLSARPARALDLRAVPGRAAGAFDLRAVPGRAAAPSICGRSCSGGWRLRSGGRRPGGSCPRSRGGRSPGMSARARPGGGGPRGRRR